MKVSELMVGDWVYVVRGYDKHLTIEKVKGVIADKDEPYPVTLSTGETVSLNDIRPIPLTSDILVKNGFIYNKEQTEGDIQSVYYHFTKFYDFPLGRGFYIEYDTEDNIYWLTDHCWIRFKYVHTLQHLLRLCGLEKELTI